MTPDLTIDADAIPLEDKRGHKGPERRCVACGQTRDKSGMIRFVKAPDDQVVPDIAEKLPGRGVWVCANKEALAKAIKTGGFARGLKARVKADDTLIDMTTDLLKKRVLSLLTMALKGGQAYMGFDQVRSAAKGESLAFRIEASDGSEGGRGKIRVLTKAADKELEQRPTSVIGCFSAAELGRAFGREDIVHAAIKRGRMAGSFRHSAHRLAGFCDLIPENWNDLSHEEGQISAFECGDKG